MEPIGLDSLKSSSTIELSLLILLERRYFKAKKRLPELNLLECKLASSLFDMRIMFSYGSFIEKLKKPSVLNVI